MLLQNFSFRYIAINIVNLYGHLSVTSRTANVNNMVICFSVGDFQIANKIVGKRHGEKYHEFVFSDSEIFEPISVYSLTNDSV